MLDCAKRKNKEKEEKIIDECRTYCRNKSTHSGGNVGTCYLHYSDGKAKCCYNVNGTKDCKNGLASLQETPIPLLRGNLIIGIEIHGDAINVEQQCEHTEQCGQSVEHNRVQGAEIHRVVS